MGYYLKKLNHFRLKANHFPSININKVDTQLRRANNVPYQLNSVYISALIKSFIYISPSRTQTPFTIYLSRIRTERFKSSKMSGVFLWFRLLLHFSAWKILVLLETMSASSNAPYFTKYLRTSASLKSSNNRVIFNCFICVIVRFLRKNIKPSCRSFLSV